jgi:hypothetical protein
VNPQLNGGPDWALAFAEFHARHRDVKGKKLVFTAIFNAAMDAFITCSEVPLVWRVLAWIWRCSWGKDSDYCVDGIGGSPLGQQACADQFGVDKRRVHDCVTILRQLNFVLPPDGHKLYPVDDPTNPPPKDPNTTDVESPDPSGLFREFCDEWKVRSLADFRELESAEATVNRLKIVRLEQFREWRKARSNHAQTIKPNTQQVNEEKQSSSSALPTLQASPPPREEPVQLNAKPEEEEGSLYQKFKASYPAHRFHEAQAKPFFDKKIQSEQAHILERLQVYLTCGRWQDEGGQYIPWVGKWLQSYDMDPPAALRLNKQRASGSDERILKLMAGEAV